jgi:hypothetical protein
MEDNTQQTNDDSDFKYCMQDTEKIYIGARFSYQDLMDEEHVPFKFQTIIEHYISKDTALSTTLESHLYYMKPEDFSCRTYQHLKAKVKYTSLKEKKSLFGRPKLKYVESTLPVKEFAEINLAQKKAAGVVVNELILSKFSVAGFHV